jgi:hypothetical protein
MARFMMFIYPDAAPEDWQPKPEDVESMMAYNAELEKAGALLALDGLFPDTHASIITWSEGKTTVTDGPFTEAKELVGGYWIIQAKNLDEAKEWARRCPMGDATGKIEIRQIRDLEDYSDDVQAVLEQS